ncbi:MAG: Holliday junction branch migration protein RuvA [Elusimicrobia bacterium CG03_land_8_20_14_0_80_50_18]|nr:MAG: Holliday junction branch migration protein RuvA [Elusimicrobia bacterium CG03_land_8_20_14_0_80_50_18]PIX14409.1 MAG: Holliday junction branch migration protein RuvA [Elusimicrobia bacterium CG_4_8_14_3_um_filter_50_9]
MIALLKGIVVDKSSSVVIAVSGIGFELFMTDAAKISLPDPGEECLVYTQMKHNRDELPQLYGFIKKEERDIFKLLTSVSGVGAKVSIALLNAYTPSQIVSSISSGDVKALSAVSGLGEKSAKRIIVDLKDKVRKLEIEDDGVIIRGDFADAAAALTAMGWPFHIARSAVEDVMKHKGAEMPVQDIIKQALAKLDKRK